MKKTTRIILILLIVLLILGIILFPKIKQSFTSSDTEDRPVASKQMSQALSVNALVLKPETLTDQFKTKGILLPDEEVNLSFETSGKIIKIYFQEGALVQKGELLATVNDEILQAELKKLKAQLPLAQERASRQKTLLEKDAVSKESYESVLTDLETLKADIELVQSRITQTELRAPFDGVMGLRMISEGAYASPTTIISTLTKVSPLKLEFSINEKQVNEIKRGTKVVFTVENDLNTYNATVYAVESKLDEKTLSLKVRATYPNSNGRLKPGQSASVDINMGNIPNTIVIPSASTVAEMGKSIAYVYNNGKARMVTIERGMRTAASVQVIQGLQEGDTLLTTGVMQLRDGMPVTISTIER